MNVGLFQGAASLDSLERWQEAIAQNIAFSSAAGYKKVGMSMEGALMGELPSRTQTTFGELLDGISPDATQEVDFGQGPLIQTQVRTHAAIQGEGFFQLEAPDGTTLYTRDGQFHLSPENTLVNRNGFPVKGEGGDLQLVPQNGEVTIDKEGNVKQGTIVVGKLDIVSVDDLSALVPAGGGFILLEGSGAETKPVENPNVAQGFYEGSNVSPVEEMVKLITVSRAYESSQKVLNAYDENYEQAIRNLGPSA